MLNSFCICILIYMGYYILACVFSIESFPQEKFFFQLDILNPSVMFDRWSVESYRYGWSKSVLITDQFWNFLLFGGRGVLSEIHQTEGLRWGIDLTVTLFYKVPELAEIKLIRHIFFQHEGKELFLHTFGVSLISSIYI